jgi:hypothetical protein
MKEEIIFDTGYTEDEVQSFSQANYGRELTEIEIHRMKDYLWDDDDVSWARIELMAKAIEAVIDNEGDKWKSVDEDYQTKQNQNEQ